LSSEKRRSVSFNDDFAALKADIKDRGAPSQRDELENGAQIAHQARIIGRDGDESPSRRAISHAWQFVARP
jgi:hypothetical protein